MRPNLGVLVLLAIILLVVIVLVLLIVKLIKPSQPAQVQITGNPAGWYPDPNDAGLLRYWDGNQWTGDTAQR